VKAITAKEKAEAVEGASEMGIKNPSEELIKTLVRGGRQRASVKKWHSSPKGKAAQKKYHSTPEAKAKRLAYNKKDEVKERQRKYHKERYDRQQAILQAAKAAGIS